MKALLVVALLLGSVAGSFAASAEPRLEDYSYPFSVEMFRFVAQRQELEMAYMDVKPTGTPRGTVVLLHGKNFSGAYWKTTAEALRDAGFRVIMPDQIGFGKSSKPEHFQYSFHQLVQNTHALLDHLGIQHAHMLGHSMGGMIATRYALMFPAATESLLLVDPLGLEDWKAKGVPYTRVDAAYDQELQQTPEKIRAYQKENYYHGEWRPEYEAGVTMLTRFLQSPSYPRMAWNQALTSEMIYSQPVVYEFPNIKVRTLLVIGELDRTAPGRNSAPAEMRAELGNYPKIAKDVVGAIPGAKLVQIDGVGHLPHVEAFPRFIAAITDFLESRNR